jgi:hypothetical protein
MLEKPKTLTEQVKLAVELLLESKPNGFYYKEVSELVPLLNDTTVLGVLSRLHQRGAIMRVGKGRYAAVAKSDAEIREAYKTWKLANDPKSVVKPIIHTVSVDLDKPSPKSLAEYAEGANQKAIVELQEAIRQSAKTSRALPDGPMPANKDDAIEWLLSYVENLESENQDLYRQLCVTQGQQDRAEAIRERYVNRLNWSAERRGNKKDAN